MDIKHKNREGDLGIKAKTARYVWPFLLHVMIFSSCSNNYGLHMEEPPKSIDKTDKKIVFVSDAVFPKDFRSLSEHQSNTLQKKDGQKEIIFSYVQPVNSEQDYHASLVSMHNRAELFKRSVKKSIKENGWDKDKNDFIMVGHHEEGLSVLEAAETLKDELNLKRLIIVGAPLNGHEFMQENYSESRGAIGLMLKGMRQAISGQNSTVIEELTPHSTYLQQRHAFIESQTDENDLKISIMDTSSKNNCLKVERAGVDTWESMEINYGPENPIVYKEDFDIAIEQILNRVVADFEEKHPAEEVRNLDQLQEKIKRAVRRAYNKGIKEELNQAYQSKCKRDLTKLYSEVAQKIRQGYDQASKTKNVDDLPGVEEFRELRSFIESKGKAGHYLFFEKLNGGEEHNGMLSISTQRAENITNPRVERSSYEGYTGTLSIPYKELKNLGPLNIFDKEDYIFSNEELKEEIFRLVLET